MVATDTRETGGIDVSVLVPVYNEVDNVQPLMREIEAALTPTGYRYEVIWIDDASVDGTREKLEQITGDHPAMRIVQHQQNCGQSAAYATGFRAGRGTCVVTMDGDGQHDPADIPVLIEALDESIDCVAGFRRERHDRWLKRVASRIANGFRNRVTGDQVTDAGCTIRAIRAECLTELPVFNGMHRFVPTLLRAQGFTVKECPVHHRPRSAGASKYGVSDRLWRGIRDCLAIRWYRARAFPGRRIDGCESQSA